MKSFAVEGKTSHKLKRLAFGILVFDWLQKQLQTEFSISITQSLFSTTSKTLYIMYILMASSLLEFFTSVVLFSVIFGAGVTEDIKQMNQNKQTFQFLGLENFRITISITCIHNIGKACQE